MENIDVFAFSKLKLMNDKPSRIVSWITILVVFVIFFVVLGIFLNFNIYSSYIGYVEINNDYNLRIIINDKSFPINKNYKLYIDNKRYSYKITKIEKSNGYYELLVNCKLDENLLINNNILTVRFKKYSTTLMKEMLKRIKKGMV